MRLQSGVLYNLGLMSIGQMVSQLLNVWALVYLAGVLGSHWFGVVQVGVAVMSYALITAEWGLMSLGIREVSRLSSQSSVFEYARTHSGLLALQTVGVGLLAWLVLPRLPFYTDDPIVFQFYLLAILPQVLTLTWVATGLEQLSWVASARVILSLSYALLIMLGLAPLSRLIGLPEQRLVPLIFVFSSGIGAAFMFIPVYRWFGKFPWPRWPERQELRRRWHLSAPIGGSIVILRVLLNIDLILLGILATPTIVGNYAAASRLVFLIVVAVEVLWGALLPRLSRLAALEPSAFAAAFNRYLGFVIAGLLPIMVGGWILGPRLLALIYKGRYDQSGTIFQILCLSYALLALGTYLGNSLIATDQQNRHLPPVVAAAVAAVTGNVLLIPCLGAAGAAWGMFIAHGLYFLWLVILNRRRFERVLGQTILALLPGTALLALIARWLDNWPILVGIAVAGGVYSAAAAWPLQRLHRLTESGSNGQVTPTDHPNS